MQASDSPRRGPRRICQLRIPLGSARFRAFDQSYATRMVERVPVSVKPRRQIEAGRSLAAFLYCSIKSCRYLRMASAKAASCGKGGRSSQLLASSPRPRIENASTRASSSRWLGKLGDPGVASCCTAHDRLVAKLIGELAPIERADINDDPGGIRIFVVKPDVTVARMCGRRPAILPAAGRTAVLSR